MQLLRSRLELLKNLIILEEQALLALQMTHLAPYAEQYPAIAALIEAIHAGRYGQAQQITLDFLQAQTGLVRADEAQAAALAFEAKQLENQLQILIEQQAEQQARLDEFNFLHHRALSPLLAEVLAARRQLATDRFSLLGMPLRVQHAQLAQQIRALQAQQAEINATLASLASSPQYAERAQAQEDFAAFTADKAKEQARFASLDSLSDSELLELKRLYRRACKLTHPDLVDDALRAEAHQKMVAVNSAKEAGDLALLRQLLAELESGLWRQPAVLFSSADKLRQRITALEAQIATQTQHLAAQQADDTLMAILHADDLATYFASQRQGLSELLGQLQQEQQTLAGQLAHYQAQLAALQGSSACEEAAYE
ncbi:MAG: hypothetical protein ACRCYV_08415 [Aeromonas sp.]